jgi:hypothetical protein
VRRSISRSSNDSPGRPSNSIGHAAPHYP